MDAELAYVFRHALLRDTAYQLQLPSDRAKLHALALEVIEAVMGGPPPPIVADGRGELILARHALDGAAEELAFHAKLGQAAPGAYRDALAISEAGYLFRAAEWANERCHYPRALSLFEAVASHPAAIEELRVRALREAGWLQYLIGQPELSKTQLEQSVTLARKRGIRHQEGKALGALAFVLGEMGRTSESEALAKEALVIQRENRARGDEGRTLTFLANIAAQTGREPEAERLYNEALEIFRAESDLRGQGFALANLAAAINGQKRSAEGEAVYNQALAILRKIGNRRIEAIVLGNLAGMHEKKGDLSTAESLYSQALAIHREVGNVRSEGFALGNVASLYEDTGRIELAQQAFEQALAIHAKLKAKWNLAVHRCDYALFKLRRGLNEEGAAMWLLGAAALREFCDRSELNDKVDAMQKACREAGVARFDSGEA